MYKPTPSIFLHAVAELKVSPEACVFVGDNLEGDAIGAVEKGEFQTGLWLDRGATTSTALSTDVSSFPPHVHRITTLADVIDYI